MKKLMGMSLISLGFCVSAFAEQHVAPDLHTDPFISPLDQLQVEVVEQTNDVEPLENETESRESFLWQPEIRGVIHSDEILIVNIGGNMIEAGTEYEGFRLIKIKGQSVVFEKDGKQVFVSVDGTD